MITFRVNNLFVNRPYIYLFIFNNFPNIIILNEQKKEKCPKPLYIYKFVEFNKIFNYFYILLHNCFLVLISIK